MRRNLNKLILTVLSFVFILLPTQIKALDCDQSFGTFTVSNNPASVRPNIGICKKGDCKCSTGNVCDNWAGISNSQYSTSFGTLFCVDPNFNGPGNQKYCKTSAVDSRAYSAIMTVYNYYSSTTKNYDHYRVANAALRLVYEHFGISSGTEAFPKGTQYCSQLENGKCAPTNYPLPIYTNTMKVIDAMNAEYPNADWWSSEINPTTTIEYYKKTTTELGLDLKSVINPNGGFDGSGNPNMWGKGQIANIIAVYINAIKHSETNPTVAGDVNVKVNLTNNGPFIAEEVNGNYVTHITISLSGMPSPDIGKVKNISIEPKDGIAGTIAFDSPDINSSILNQGEATYADLSVTITIPREKIINNNIVFDFNVKFTYEDLTGLSSKIFEACYTIDGVTCATPETPRQRMMVFVENPAPISSEKTYPLSVTIQVAPKNCDTIEENPDGTHNYYDPIGNLINKGSEEENKKEHDRVCNLVCFVSPELTPGSTPPFNEGFFDAEGCCNQFDPIANAEHQEYYNQHCNNKCYVGSLDPKSENFDEAKFKVECCSDTPPAGYEPEYIILCPPEACYSDPELTPENTLYSPDRYKNECCSLPRPTDPIFAAEYDRRCLPPVGDPCDPTINAPAYCTINQTVTINESNDFERCIWNKTDKAGNSYNLSQQGLTNNPYCTVSCKEDYKINLPSIVPSVRAGQYFVLTTQVKGTRTCKSTEINQTKFDTDIKNLSQRVINAYNAWSKANAYEKATLEKMNGYKVGDTQYDTLEEAKEYVESIHSVDKWNEAHEDGPVAKKSSWSGGNPNEFRLYDEDNKKIETSTDTISDWFINTEIKYDSEDYDKTCKKKYEPPAEPGGERTCTVEETTTGTCKTEQKKAVIPSYKTYTYNSATNSIAVQTISPDPVEDLGYVSATSCDCESSSECEKTTAEKDWAEQKASILGNKTLQDYKDELTSAITALNDAFTYQQACATWNNDYNFNPIISYDYDEDYYMQQIIKNNNVFVADGEPTATEDKEYCNGSNCSSASTITKPVSYVSCDTTTGCSVKPKTVHNNTRVSQIKSYDATYKPKVTFYTQNATGQIAGTINGNKPNPADDYTKLGHVFPVSLLTPKGNYHYTLTYDNIGQYNDTEIDNLGRFTGSSNGKPSLYEKLNYDNQYVCNYNVVKDICIDCPPPGGGGPGGGGFDYFYRPISLYDVFPNSKSDTSPKDYLQDKETRLIGANWTSVKGKFTQEKIERQNAEAYSEAEYSFTLTPANMMKIREYNKEHQYNDFNLSCNSEGIDCTSNFLRDGLQEGYFKEATLNNVFIHANDVEHDSPRGITICTVGANNDASCVGPSWK